MAPDGKDRVQGTAELRIGDQTLALPIIEGSEGERAVDIRKLRDQTGFVTLDPGYATPARAGAPSPSSTAIAASCAIAATRSRSSPRARASSRSHTC